MTGSFDQPPGERLDALLASLRAGGRVGIMAHLVAGYPDLETSRKAAERLVRAGADVLEVQLPFSDPTADGPVITHACQTALERGVRVRDVFDWLEEFTAECPVPVLVMSYYNLVFAYRGSDGEGPRGFARRAARAGISGAIVPDIPPEARDEGFPEACREAGIHPIYVISPNAPDHRLQAIATVASGLVYATSRTGTTGREMELALEDLKAFLARARGILGLPLAVGFSISRREQVEALRGHAELAVVGTHLLRAFDRGGLDGLEEALRALKAS